MTNNTTTEVKVSCIKLPGWRIELSTNKEGKPVAHLLKLLTAGRDKGTFKKIEGFYFMNEGRRDEWIADKLFDIKSRQIIKEKEKAAKKAIRENMQHGFEVGQIYYDSWGYEQTNVDFYEVIEVKAKSVVIREIAGNIRHENGYSSMSGFTTPVPGNYTSDPIQKNIQFYIDSTGKTIYYIKSKHGWISKYDGGDKGVYSSWYA